MRKVTLAALLLGPVAAYACGGSGPSGASTEADGGSDAAPSPSSSSGGSSSGSSTGSSGSSSSSSSSGSSSGSSSASSGGSSSGGEDAGPPTYTVGGQVTGLTGTGLVLTNGSDSVVVNAAGSFVVSSHVPTGTAYAVTVGTNPACPTQICTVTTGTGSGTVTTADVTSVIVSCSAGTTVSLVTTSWGDETIRVTPNIHSLANGATAAPNEIAGVLTTLTSGEGPMNLTVDPTRNLAYVADNGLIKSFANIVTATGNVVPKSTITVAGTDTPIASSASIDPGRNVLYVLGTTGSTSASPVLWVFDAASTLSGTVTPSVTVPFVATNQAHPLVFVDPVNDRLYLNTGVSTTNDVVLVYDHASAITATTAATRTITIAGVNVGPDFTSLWVDACKDNLYITDRDGSTGGNNVFGFHDASTLDTTVQMDTSSFVRMTLVDAMNVMVDNNDALFAWPDSATTVSIYSTISLKTGVIMPSLSVNGTVNSGYGMASIVTQ